MDPFLSRYTVPNLQSKNEIPTGDVVRLRYRGFIPAAYLIKLFILMTKGVDGAQDSKAWAVIQAHGFGGEAVTVLRTPNVSEGSKTTGDEKERDMESKPVAGEGAGIESVENNAKDEDVEMDGEVTGGLVDDPKMNAMKDEKADAKSGRNGAMFVCWENAAVL